MTTTMQVGVLTPSPILDEIRKKLTEHKTFGERVLKWGKLEEDAEHDLFLVFTTLEEEQAVVEEEDPEDSADDDVRYSQDAAVLEKLGLGEYATEISDLRRDNPWASRESRHWLRILRFDKSKKPKPPKDPKGLFQIIGVIIIRFLARDACGISLAQELPGILMKPQRYSIYKPLLLLPSSHQFGTDEWKRFFRIIPHAMRDNAYAAVVKEFGVTHMAINSPIPTGGDSKGEGEHDMRKPVDLTPLYGDFGSTDFDEPDFDKALWVSTKQNGIYQTWPPVHVMFSRGNLREKTRLLSHFRDTTSDGGGPVTVVDLYVGIGYFSFSYLKAGAALVLGWDINRWSIEACRRGAAGNRWRAAVAQPDVLDADVETNDIVLFHEPNDRAVERITAMKTRLPPITHINLGILPTSQASYLTAVRIALLNDPPRSCWIHVHENANEDEVQAKAEEVTGGFKRLVAEESAGDSKWHVDCTHVERVKSWAPKVFHYVFDINIYPVKAQEG